MLVLNYNRKNHCVAYAVIHGTSGGKGASYEQSTSLNREIRSRGAVKWCGAGSPGDIPLI